MSLVDDINVIKNEQKAIYFERAELIDVIWTTILAGENCYLLGVPGTAKSDMCRDLTQRIDGARYFDVLFDRQLPKEDIFGPRDLKHYQATGEWKVKTTGKMPEAHIFFGDEADKAGPTVLNPLLTAVNEHKFHNGNGHPIDIPLISFFAATNAELELEELSALWDRFLLRYVVESIKSPDNFEALLATVNHAPRNVQRTMVPLDQVLKAKDELVPAVRLTPAIIKSMRELRTSLAEHGIKPSDRRWKKAGRVLQAYAFLNDHTEVEEGDLEILKHVLWDLEEQRPTVRNEVTKRMGEWASEVQKLGTQVNELLTEAGKIVPADMDKAQLFGAMAKVLSNSDRFIRDAEELKEKALREGKSVTQLDNYIETVRSTRTQVNGLT